MSLLTRSLATAVAALLLAFLVAAPVAAHAELKSSDPEDKAVLATPPTVITLTFTEGLDLAKSSFELNGPAGIVGKGKPVEQGGEVMTLDGLVLAPGAYSIKWTSAATDGHLDRGTLSFTVLEATPAPPSTAPAPTTPSSGGGSSAAPSALPGASATDPAAPASTPVASPAGTDVVAASSSGSDVLLPILVGLVLVAGLGAFILRRSRRA